jgi:hypothetical protein
MDDVSTPIKNTKQAETVGNQDQTVEMVNGIACPIDPQARLECESCQ